MLKYCSAYHFVFLLAMKSALILLLYKTGTYTLERKALICQHDEIKLFVFKQNFFYHFYLPSINSIKQGKIKEI